MAKFGHNFKELLQMASIYRKHQRFGLAAEILEDLIAFEDRSQTPDKKSLALASFYLAEIYSDQELYSQATPLYTKAAELWHSINPKQLISILWYLESLQDLQSEAEAQITLAEEFEKKDRKSA